MKGIIEIASFKDNKVNIINKVKYKHFRHAEEDYKLACKKAVMQNFIGSEYFLLLYKDKCTPGNLFEYQTLKAEYAISLLKQNNFFMNEPVTKFWETDTRYYTVELILDLLGDWTIYCNWGGKSINCNSYDDGLIKLERLNKKRKIWKYKIVECQIQMR